MNDMTTYIPFFDSSRGDNIKDTIRLQEHDEAHIVHCPKGDHFDKYQRFDTYGESVRAAQRLAGRHGLKVRRI